MSDQSRKNNEGHVYHGKSSSSARLQNINQSLDYIKNHASLVAGVFCLATLLLIVGVWRLAANHSSTKADTASTSDITNSTGVSSNSQTAQFTTVQSSNGSTDVTVQKPSSGPESVTINGQPVSVPATGSVSKQVSGNSVNINVQDNSSASGSLGHTSVFSNTSSHVNAYSHTTGGTIITNN